MRGSKFSVRPTLDSHKGTVVRTVIKTNSEDEILIEPLCHPESAGLILNARGAKDLIPNLNAVSENISLINAQGNVIISESLSGQIISIENTVIYPNGCTWEGEVLEKGEIDPALMIWSWDLGKNQIMSNYSSYFGFSEPWNKVPTVILLFGNENIRKNCGIEHKCPQRCHGYSKFL